jgi:hypothetical protein
MGTPRAADGSAVILRVLPDLMAAIAAAGLASVTLKKLEKVVGLPSRCHPRPAEQTRL